jgi:hypothetical protein
MGRRDNVLLPMLSILTTLSTLALTLPPPPFGDARHPVTQDVRQVPRARPAPPVGANFFQVSYLFYRTVVTPIDGPRCAHRPTCSAYAMQAVRRHGVVGLWLAYDRLLRGARSSAVRQFPVAFERGRIVYLDPLEESTFWLP